MDRHDQSLLLSACADGELSAAEKASLDLHLSGCAACRRELEAVRGVKGVLAAAQVRPIPPGLVARLEDDFEARRAGAAQRRAWFWPRLWVPAGAMAALALAALWFGARSYFIQDDYLPLEPLVAAHSRYSAESLVPQSVPPASNVYSQLALYHGDEQ